MKMMNFNSVRDKVAIVTGASRGIGRAIAECFGENGMKVVCAARSAEQGQAVADGICAKGGDAIFLQTDCSKASAIKELVDKTVAHYGKLDGVVSNAGIGMGGTPLHEYEVEDYEKIFSLNSEGVFAGMKYGAEAILKSHSEGGFLINVASVAGLVPQRGQALYSATKFGVVGMTRAAALDYAEYGMDVLQNMMLLSELVQCGGNVYTWCYDAQGKLLRSNCPDEAFLASAFELFGCKQRMLEHGNRDDVPVTLGTALGLLWGAAFEKEEEKLKRVWVIGPVFYQDVTLRGIEDGLKYYSKLEISVAWTIQLYKALEKVPTLQNTIMNRYLLMMHYCLTGQRLELSCVNSSTAQEERLKSATIPHDRHKIWMAEQGMLQMVRTGDMNYKQALSNSMSISAGVPVQSSDVLRQSKTSIIVFTSLVCRAAIEGGLSPEEAYSLGDSYIQAAESAKSLDELSPLAMMMYDDFIRRVHKHRTNPNLSRQIQKCVDYIEMNLDKKIIAEDLAVLVGYTEYYLTHKFKEETGLSVTNYVKFAKVERAKVLLKSTPLSVREISEQLGFATRNYFSAVFQQVTGKTPMEFRET